VPVLLENELDACVVQADDSLDFTDGEISCP
jgi:hypothetical protein